MQLKNVLPFLLISFFVYSVRKSFVRSCEGINEKEKIPIETQLRLDY